MLLETDSTFHHVVELITTIGLPAIVAGVGKLIWNSSKLATTVELIRTNHLPHLDDKIEGIGADVKELRGQFVKHLELGDK